MVDNWLDVEFDVKFDAAAFKAAATFGGKLLKFGFNNPFASRLPEINEFGKPVACGELIRLFAGLFTELCVFKPQIDDELFVLFNRNDDDEQYPLDGCGECDKSGDSLLPLDCNF